VPLSKTEEVAVPRISLIHDEQFAVRFGFAEVIPWLARPAVFSQNTDVQSLDVHCIWMHVYLAHSHGQSHSDVDNPPAGMVVNL
jgi:hypothetical protein